MRRRVAAVLLLVPGLCALGACSGSPAPTGGSAGGAPTASMTYYPSGSPSPASPGSAGSTSATPGVEKTSGAASPTSGGSAPATPTGTAGAPAGGTSSVALPDLPAAATAHTPDGAAAFARYYLELVNYAWQKPDPAPLKKHSDPTCKSCAAMVERARQYATSQERLDRPAFEVASSDASAELAPGIQSVIVIGRQPAYRLITASGTSKPAKEDALNLQVALRFSPAGWLVRSIKTVS